MSIRNSNKKLNIIIQDNVTGDFKSYPLDEDFTTQTINAIIENVTEKNIQDRIGYKVDFLIVK